MLESILLNIKERRREDLSGYLTFRPTPVKFNLGLNRDYSTGKRLPQATATTTEVWHTPQYIHETVGHLICNHFSRKVVLEKWFCKLGFFLGQTLFLNQKKNPSLQNNFSRTTFLENWLQIKWLNVACRLANGELQCRKRDTKRSLNKHHYHQIKMIAIEASILVEE